VERPGAKAVGRAPSYQGARGIWPGGGIGRNFSKHEGDTSTCMKVAPHGDSLLQIRELHAPQQGCQAWASSWGLLGVRLSLLETYCLGTTDAEGRKFSSHRPLYNRQGFEFTLEFYIETSTFHLCILFAISPKYQL
jgi:hypothetical protein